MAFRQLTGQTAHTAPSNTGPAVLVAVLALAAVLAVAAWRLVPHNTSAIDSPPAAPVTPHAPSAALSANAAKTSDLRLYLTHAEQELVAAAEQLNTARRLLAALSPDLSRSYLQFEKRRADNAWRACDNAQRAVEQAREHIKVIVSTGKDQ
jgi:hypothetical protein